MSIYLQTQWQILTLPCKLWSVDAMNDVIICCINLHNMIIEDEWDHEHDNNAYLFDDGFQVNNINHDTVTSLLDFQLIHSE